MFSEFNEIFDKKALNFSHPVSIRHSSFDRFGFTLVLKRLSLRFGI